MRSKPLRVRSENHGKDVPVKRDPEKFRQALKRLKIRDYRAFAFDSTARIVQSPGSPFSKDEGPTDPTFTLIKYAAMNEKRAKQKKARPWLKPLPKKKKKNKNIRFWRADA
jgi:hypothetical protein